MATLYSTSDYPDTLRGKILCFLGLDEETAPVLWIILGGLIVSAAVIYLTHGNAIAAGAVLGVLALIALSFYRLDYSFFALIGFVLLFDQFRIPGFWPYTFTIDYFRNLKEISFLPTFSAGVVNPIEIHLLLIYFIWFFILSIKKGFQFKRIPVWGAFLLFFGWFGFSLGYGMMTGGIFLNALWELRALFYFALLYVSIPQVIQTRKQLKILIWIFIAAITVKALQGIARYVILGFSMQGRPTLTNHEDPVFIVTLIILLLGLWMYKVKNPQRKILLLLLIPLMFGFAVAMRRAAVASLLVSLAAFFVLIPGKKQWKMFKYTFPIVILLFVYGAVAWNATGAWTQPVKMIKSGFERPSKAENPEDYYSNLYRDYENYNLAYTTQKHPVIGVGFGKKYLQPMELANITFSLRDYIPHNEIFWVIVKSGSVGFFLFWFFWNCFAFQGAYITINLGDPYLKAVGTMIVIAVINQMVVSFFDLQLTYYRNMIYLGALMGLLPVIQDLDILETKKLESGS